MSVSRRKFIQIGGLTLTASGLVSKVFAKGSERFQSGLQNLTKDVKPLTDDDYLKRIEKAKELLKENNMDALLLTGSVNLNYFTNVNWGRSERTFGAIINTKGDPIWVCPSFELQRAEERIKFGKNDIRTWEEHESPYKVIGGIMKDLGASSGKLGVGPTVRNFVLEGIKKSVPGIEIADGSPVTDGCRGIKDEKEIAYMDLANKITKLSYQEAFKYLEEGMEPSSISGMISRFHGQMGANGGAGVQIGPNSAFPHGSAVKRVVKDGQVVMADGGCGVEGYRSDVTRTIVFGKPSDRLKRVWDIIRKSQSEALKAVRPGVTCETIDKVGRKVVEDAGFGPDYKYFTHRLGHGIGREGHEYPYLVRGNKLKLQPGMTFSDEPGIYLYGEFGVRLEDCFVVTEDGGKILGGMESTAIDKPFGV